MWGFFSLGLVFEAATIAWLLRRYAAPSVQYIVLATTAYAWAVSMSIVLITPMDVAATLMYEPEPAVSVLWKITYWSTQVCGGGVGGKAVATALHRLLLGWSTLQLQPSDLYSLSLSLSLSLGCCVNLAVVCVLSPPVQLQVLSNSDFGPLWRLGPPATAAAEQRLAAVNSVPAATAAPAVAAAAVAATAAAACAGVDLAGAALLPGVC